MKSSKRKLAGMSDPFSIDVTILPLNIIPGFSLFLSYDMSATLNCSVYYEGRSFGIDLTISDILFYFRLPFLTI